MGVNAPQFVMQVNLSIEARENADANRPIGMRNLNFLARLNPTIPDSNRRTENSLHHRLRL
jgi:hypothetical protein